MKITLEMPPSYSADALKEAAKKSLGTDAFFIVHRSLDARRKQHIHYVLTISNEAPPQLVLPQKIQMKTRPYIIGGGPCGLFAALWLSLCGARPVLVERGSSPFLRTAFFEKLCTKRLLEPQDNLLFGIGGAGAFSDGKLTTGTKSPFHRFILQTMVECGAPEEILYEAHPHIGSDRLRDMLTALMKKIQDAGGEIACNTQATMLTVRDDSVVGLTLKQGGQTKTMQTDSVILAIGHSARDTMKMLYDAGVQMEQKAFAVGFRIEHLQEKIDEAQYGQTKGLPPAIYKLTAHQKADVYTFCMCPGGYVVPAMHETHTVCTNGMSLYRRDGKNANAAVVTPVSTKMFEGTHPLAGVAFQKAIEEKAYDWGGRNYNAPICGLSEFMGWGRKPHIAPTYRPGVTEAPLSSLYPEKIIEAIRAGILEMDQKLRGFSSVDAVLTGPETRTSSPVRIKRDASGQSNIRGLYPAGEGAGWAGGILSAAADGIRQAEHLIQNRKEELL